MAQLIYRDISILDAAVAHNSSSYVKARTEAETLSTDHSLRVADMPLGITALTQNPKIRAAIRPNLLDTITGEYHGQRNGQRSYETWHSTGSLATSEGLARAFPKQDDYGFMLISPEEWNAIGKGAYQGTSVQRVHLEEARNGDVPKAGTPYTIFTLLDTDRPGINESTQLSYDQFMKDDRVLMITGSPEYREALAKMFFGEKEDGGEGWTSVGSYHRIHNAPFGLIAKGRLSFVSDDYYGLDGYDYILPEGCFLVVRDIRPTRDQIVAVVNNPDLNREGMLRAVNALYQ